jgi:predicted AAA+ superfamily ATPase
MIEEGEYFVINRPRQYGKTTTLFRLEQELKKDSHYLVIDISFEGIDSPTYSDQKLFIPTFLDLLKKSLAFNH